MPIALVTGADGFIGSRLVELLVKKIDNTTHVLNSVSPAFTSVFHFQSIF